VLIFQPVQGWASRIQSDTAPLDTSLPRTSPSNASGLTQNSSFSTPHVPFPNTTNHIRLPVSLAYRTRICFFDFSRVDYPLRNAFALQNTALAYGPVPILSRNGVYRLGLLRWPIPRLRVWTRNCPSSGWRIVFSIFASATPFETALHSAWSELLLARVQAASEARCGHKVVTQLGQNRV